MPIQIRMKKFLFIFFLMFVCCEEESDNCEIETIECQDNKVMICNGDQTWEMVMDCDGLGNVPHLHCCDRPDTGINCWLKEECNEI